MKCAICRGGPVEPGLATVTLNRGGATLVVRSVPARVCRTCGEEYVDEATTSRLLRSAEEAARAGVTLGVQDYVAA